MISLTPRQAKLKAFLRDYIAEHGYAPTVRETMDGMGTKSAGRVHEMLLALVERGHIRRLPWKSRAIEILDGKPPVSLRDYSTTDLQAELERRQGD